MHNVYKVGAYWQNIPGYKGRATCPLCNVVESLEHILTECSHLGQEHVWKLVEKIHEKRKIEFSKPSLGEILGCVMIRRKGTHAEEGSGPQRFSTIVVSEAAHIIWRIRCTWRIADGSDPEKLPVQKTIENQVIAAIARRIKIDCLATNTQRYGKKAIKTRLVANIWKFILPRMKDPVRSWRKITEVLVGIG